MALIIIKLPHNDTLRENPTRKLTFQEVADFDDIVEKNYEWKSRFAGDISDSSQRSNSLYSENSERLFQKASSMAHTDSKNSNPSNLQDKSDIKNVNTFKRSSSLDLRKLFTFPIWKRSQDEKYESYSANPVVQDGNYYYVRKKKPETLTFDRDESESRFKDNSETRKSDGQGELYFIR